MLFVATSAFLLLTHLPFMHHFASFLFVFSSCVLIVPFSTVSAQRL